MGLFSDISWSIVPLEDGTFILQYIFIETVQEIPITILPYYNIETGWSIRGGWLINNYRGRNQTLGIIGSFGGLNTYGLKFNSIVRRTGLPKGVVRDWLEVLFKEEQVILYNTFLDRYFINKKNI